MEKTDKNTGGRPEEFTVKYFPHHAEQEQIVRLIIHRFKNTGYAIFYRLCELLAKTKYHFIDIRDAEGLELLCAELDITEDELRPILQYLADKKYLEVGLYQSGVIYSTQFVDDLKPAYRLRMNEPWAADDIKSYLNGSLSQRKKVAKKETKTKLNNTILKETPVSNEETPVSKEETLLYPDFIEDPEKYITNQAQKTGLTKPTIKRALDEFCSNLQPGQYNSMPQFNYDFGQALRTHHAALKFNDSLQNIGNRAATAERKPPPPKRTFPTPDEGRIDELCRVVLADEEFVYNQAMSLGIDKPELRIKLKLFSNENFGQFSNDVEFRAAFIDWKAKYKTVEQ